MTRCESGTRGREVTQTFRRPGSLGVGARTRLLPGDSHPVPGGQVCSVLVTCGTCCASEHWGAAVRPPPRLGHWGSQDVLSWACAWGKSSSQSPVPRLGVHPPRPHQPGTGQAPFVAFHSHVAHVQVIASLPVESSGKFLQRHRGLACASGAWCRLASVTRGPAQHAWPPSCLLPAASGLVSRTQGPQRLGDTPGTPIGSQGLLAESRSAPPTPEGCSAHFSAWLQRPLPSSLASCRGSRRGRPDARLCLSPLPPSRQGL